MDSTESWITCAYIAGKCGYSSITIRDEPYRNRIGSRGSGTPADYSRFHSGHGGSARGSAAGFKPVSKLCTGNSAVGATFATEIDAAGYIFFTLSTISPLLITSEIAFESEQQDNYSARGVLVTGSVFFVCVSNKRYFQWIDVSSGTVKQELSLLLQSR